MSAVSVLETYYRAARKVVDAGKGKGHVKIGVRICWGVSLGDLWLWEIQASQLKRTAYLGKYAANVGQNVKFAAAI
jgi:hypothetical protein